MDFSKINNITSGLRVRNILNNIIYNLRYKKDWDSTVTYNTSDVVRREILGVVNFYASLIDNNTALLTDVASWYELTAGEFELMIETLDWVSSNLRGGDILIYDDVLKKFKNASVLDCGDSTEL